MQILHGNDILSCGIYYHGKLTGYHRNISTWDIDMGYRHDNTTTTTRHQQQGQQGQQRRLKRAEV